MEEHSSKNSLVKIGDKSITRYSNALLRRALKEIPKVYSPFKTVKIGEQIWMAENLNVDHYRNGDPIPEVINPEIWANLKTGAWCYYDNNSESNKRYGKLYNWYAVIDPRGLAPEGWHVPTREDFHKLQKAVSNDGNALIDIRQGTGTNKSGFSALLSGNRGYDGEFIGLGCYTFFWGSVELNTIFACDLALYNSDSSIDFNTGCKEDGFSVRCVKDQSV
jgi:uncharacterized protein (TIGR02145 family)